MKVKKTYPIMGLGCAACVARVEKVVSALEGVSSVSVSLASATAQIEFDTDVLTDKDLQKIVHDAGYELVLAEETPSASGQSDTPSECNAGKCEAGKPETKTEKPKPSAEDIADEMSRKAFRSLTRDALCSLVLSSVIMVLAMGGGMKGCEATGIKGIAVALLSAVVVFVFGRRFFRNAWAQLRHGSANMDTLVALSISISFFFSLFNLCFPQVWTSRGLSADLYFESSAMIVAFVLLGRMLEERTRRSTTAAVRELKAMQPERVLLRVGKVVREVALESVAPGDEVVIRQGGKMAVDGEVIEGIVSMDESMMTGESRAVSKSIGSGVYAGTLCLGGEAVVRTVKVGSDTVLSSIIAMVREAQGSKAAIQRKVDKVAAVFVPVIMCIALLSLLLWCIWGGENAFSRGLLAMVTVLVIACPCSLGLATPAAIIAGIGRAARSGILVRDADALQTAAAVNVVLLDKTGTLTEGLAGGDRLKDSSVAAVRELRSMGLSVRMLSGDSSERAAEIAREAGVDEYVSQMLPAGKTQYVKDLHAKGLKVAMVGDGVNDSAALAEADFSMAMGSGSDVAMDSAMATIVSSDLRKVPQMIRLSRRTNTIIRENLFWAFFYNALAVPAAAFGLVGPMTAALCMALSSVCVVCNALRLRFCKI
jgi:P-type Cu2+ transporter